MAKKTLFSNEEFLTAVNAYLSMEAVMSDADEEGKGGEELKLGQLRENTFYAFNADAVEAFCHGIEDVAMEDAHGELHALFPRLSEFASHREQYAQLAVTLDRVEVSGSGRETVRVRRVTSHKMKGAEYRLVIFRGRDVQVAFVCRELDGFGGGTGFYTFDSRLIQRLSRELEALVRGTASRLPEFHRLQAIASAARRMETAFAREKEAMDTAFRRLQSDGVDSAHCASELEKGLTRLSRLRSQLPDMLSGSR